MLILETKLRLKQNWYSLKNNYCWKNIVEVQARFTELCMFQFCEFSVKYWNVKERIWHVDIDYNHLSFALSLFVCGPLSFMKMNYIQTKYKRLSFPSITNQSILTDHSQQFIFLFAHSRVSRNQKLIASISKALTNMKVLSAVFLAALGADALSLSKHGHGHAVAKSGSHHHHDSGLVLKKYKGNHHLKKRSSISDGDLKVWNEAAGWSALVQGIGILVLYFTNFSGDKYSTGPLTTTYLQFNTVTKKLDQVVKKLDNLNVNFVLGSSIFLLLTAFSHFSIVTYLWPEYVSQINNHINTFRWIELKKNLANKIFGYFKVRCEILEKFFYQNLDFALGTLSRPPSWSLSFPLRLGSVISLRCLDWPVEEKKSNEHFRKSETIVN